MAKDKLEDVLKQLNTEYPGAPIGIFVCVDKGIYFVRSMEDNISSAIMVDILKYLEEKDNEQR